MESKNHKIINYFISNDESLLILNWLETIKSINNNVCDNDHINIIRKNLNGNSYMFDISKNHLTKEITEFQSGNNIIDISLPTIISNIIERISKSINIKSDNVFLQVLDMEKGGKINPHYDTAVGGYITYKCNISVLSEEYSLIVDKDIFNIKKLDLYCFEASIYKHWTQSEFNSRRVLLSFGFIIPYSELGRIKDDPRIRLSNRIVKYFQSR